ncbi:hypothetical protein sos41_11570 [Alphaproteobacteria bacterium SO-S41]|nr:hypothetical protein sos41_11570 [Alphaproteobacteria bacterium SO-S41]
MSLEAVLKVPNLPGERGPFYRDAEGRLGFDGQNGRIIDYGIAFDCERGHRVFVGFRDSVLRNTVSAESARGLATAFFGSGDGAATGFQNILRDLADQCDALNAAWDRAGKPAAGIGQVTETPRGSA